METVCEMFMGFVNLIETVCERVVGFVDWEEPILDKCVWYFWMRCTNRVFH